MYIIINSLLLKKRYGVALAILFIGQQILLSYSIRLYGPEV